MHMTHPDLKWWFYICASQPSPPQSFLFADMQKVSNFNESMTSLSSGNTIDDMMDKYNIPLEMSNWRSPIDNFLSISCWCKSNGGV